MTEPRVFSPHGMPPEHMAYCIVRCSRTPDSFDQSVDWIYRNDADGAAGSAEKLFETFYFKYGHASIADNGHVVMAIENWSQVMADEIELEQLWDGQERSTRYGKFKPGHCYVPRWASDDPLLTVYNRGIQDLADGYEHLYSATLDALLSRYPRPIGMKELMYTKTIEARAFDVARYLLPMATCTNVNQITSIRTLEKQIRRLLASQYAEIRLLGEQLAEACKKPMYDVTRNRFIALLNKYTEQIESYQMPSGEARAALDILRQFGEEVLKEILPEAAPAPTLARYLEPNQYLAKTRDALEIFARDILGPVPIAERPRVDLIEYGDDHQIEVVSSALYWVSQHSYRQIRDYVRDSMSQSVRDEIWDSLFAHYDKHDELLRPFMSDQRLKFDVCMDKGGDRDMKRQRRCMQIPQKISDVHGFEFPSQLAWPELAQARESAVKAIMSAREAAAEVARAHPYDAVYLRPLCTRVGRLFSMDLAELVYIAKYRTPPDRHESYRSVAWDMYDMAMRRHPYYRKHVEKFVTHPSVENPLQR
jgi:thymidylate synthase ThyX